VGGAPGRGKGITGHVASELLRPMKRVGLRARCGCACRLRLWETTKESCYVEVAALWAAGLEVHGGVGVL
jgi:hypothetical protein